MNDVAVIDRFLDVFSRYIDSGFGLLGGEMRFLTATLVVIDVTLAGLYWAMSHASGQIASILSQMCLITGIVLKALNIPPIPVVS